MLSSNSLRSKNTLNELSQVDTDDSDAGSEYNDDEISDEDFEPDDETFSESSDSDVETNDDLVDEHIDEAIQTTIRSVIGDQSCREFDSTVDKTSKAGVIWHPLSEGSSARVRNRTTFSEKVGPTTYACKKIDSSALSAFSCIFDDSMVKKTVGCTNKEAELQKDNFRITESIFFRFLALLLCRGVFCKGVAVRDLWSKTYGLPVIGKLCSKTTFCKIMRYLRFDDKQTRNTRRSSDKFCLIRELWQRFIDNCQACYVPGQFLTADEQLIPSKSHCDFTH